MPINRVYLDILLYVLRADCRGLMLCN
jgi:hypothetical protein